MKHHLPGLVLSVWAWAALAQGISLPIGFDGVYAPMGHGCGDAGRITVKDGVMTGLDGAMTVTDLIEDPVNPRKVEASLMISGGGAEWEDSAVITLDETGKALRFDHADGSVSVWTRCD